MVSRYLGAQTSSSANWSAGLTRSRGRLRSKNDVLRAIIAVVIRLLGRVLQLVERFRIKNFARNQQRLRLRYNITPDTPIIEFNEVLENSISRKAKQLGSTTCFAFTSGTTGKPKRLIYNKHRLRNIKLQFTDVFSRACWSIGIHRTSLYVFSSFEGDQSVTSLLMSEPRLPNYFSTLQAPYRVQSDLSIRELEEGYGPTAVRLWVIAISNPGVLYATNPSTLSTFIDELTYNWERSRKLIKDWHERPASFDKRLHFIARRINSYGSAQRIDLIARSKKALPLNLITPDTRTYICWTGGYVAPFLEKLNDQLPQNVYRRIPMYSMSTEVVETVTSFRNGDTKFLPMADGVLYEFLKEGDEDLTQNLVGPSDLVAGECYTMIVSDQFGLKRYQTNDLFRCDEMVDGVPSLTFLRRRGLEYSFSGEKLTAEQLCAVYELLRADHADEFANTFFTCFPSLGHGLPRYLILAVGDAGPTRNYSTTFDELLCEINLEYRNKRASRRLGCVQFAWMGVAEFAARQPQWDSQFKVLPLYRVPMSDML